MTPAEKLAREYIRIYFNDPNAQQYHINAMQDAITASGLVVIDVEDEAEVDRLWRVWADTPTTKSGSLSYVSLWHWPVTSPRTSSGCSG